MLDGAFDRHCMAFAYVIVTRRLAQYCVLTAFALSLGALETRVSIKEAGASDLVYGRIAQ